MYNVAVFVDAGYLYAAGGEALTGHKCARINLRLRKNKTAALLKRTAQNLSIEARLLRVYWYDGVHKFGTLSSAQNEIANLADFKLRLGFINAQGQQKGVDSLIVTDLIELARNQAISDAVLVTGDEDIRIGAQLAQSYGVRVHLVGIEPTAQNQSQALRQEADTLTTWQTNTICDILEHEEPKPFIPNELEAKINSTATSESEKISAIVELYLNDLDEETVREIESYQKSNHGTPPEHDKYILAQCKTLLKRELNFQERKQMRTEFVAIIRSKTSTSAD